MDVTTCSTVMSDRVFLRAACSASNFASSAPMASRWLQMLTRWDCSCTVWCRSYSWPRNTSCHRSRLLPCLVSQVRLKQHAHPTEHCLCRKETMCVADMPWARLWPKTKGCAAVGAIVAAHYKIWFLKSRTLTVSSQKQGSINLGCR